MILLNESVVVLWVSRVGSWQRLIAWEAAFLSIHRRTPLTTPASILVGQGGVGIARADCGQAQGQLPSMLIFQAFLNTASTGVAKLVIGWRKSLVVFTDVDASVNICEM